MGEHRGCGCHEYRDVSRRHFLRTSGAVAAAATLAPAWLPRVVLARSDSSTRDVVVSIFLRGGVDALTMVPPFADKAYYQLRPTLAVPPPDSGQATRAIALDDAFGFAPAMKPLVEAYQAGDLLVVHACGLDNPTRSHFEAMHFMEVGQGDPTNRVFTGWLGRHLAATAPSQSDAVLRAVGIGYGLQRTLVGAPQTLPIEDLGTFGFGGDPRTEKARRRAIEAMYEPFSDPLRTAATNTVRTIDLLEAIDFAGYRPKGKAKYPDSDFGRALKSTAALIKADIGVEAVAIDLQGWDTHEEQGPFDGWMATLMNDLAAGLGAFHKDLFSSKRTDVIVLAMSEFGRNAFENGSAGTDHGHGSMMLALGGAIAGGRVLTKWPGLKQGQLYDGQDLAITIDYRDVITEVLTKRAGNPDPKSIFPDPTYQPKDRGVIA